MRKWVWIAAICGLSAEVCHAQWTAKDSLRLQQLLKGKEEIRIDPRAVERIDFEQTTGRMRSSDEKSWLAPDATLPELEQKPKVVLTLRPYQANTPYNWDPATRKKFVVKKDTWRSDPLRHLYAGWRQSGNRLNLGGGVSAQGMLQRGADFVPSYVAVHCYGAAGVGIGGLDLMAVFTKDFWDKKGRERRARTLEVLRTYGDSTTVLVNRPVEQIVR